jgi:hypothetical protein
MKFDSGSSRFLIMSACVFRETDHIKAVADAIESCRATHRHSREFKYNRTKARIADDFFASLQGHPFSVRAICIDKAKIYSNTLSTHPNGLKNYAIMQLLTHTYGQVKGAKLFVDGQDLQAFGMSGTDYFQKSVNQRCPGTISQVQFADSATNSLVQLADMVAGAVHRHVRLDNKQDSRHFETFKSRLWQPRGSLWMFK